MTKSIANNQIFISSVLALSFTALTSWAHAADITVMGYRGIFEDNYVKAVIEPFEKEHPDIKVTYYGVQNAATSLGNMRAQKSSPQTDAVIYDLSVAKVASEEGLVAELDTSTLSNYADLDLLGQDLGGAAIPLTYDTHTLIYNADAFKGKAPDSWEALWDKDQIGKIIIPAGGGSSIQAILLTVTANRLAGENDYKKTIEPGVRKLVELAPSIQTWEPKPDEYTLVGNGTGTLSTGWNARAQFYVNQTEGRMGAVSPKEGTATQINVISAVANGKNEEATKTFLNYAISPEAQARFSELMFYAPTNNKAVISSEAKARIPMMDPDRREKLIPIDWMAVGELRDAMLTPWRREIIPASR